MECIRKHQHFYKGELNCPHCGACASCGKIHKKIIMSKMSATETLRESIEKRKASAQQAGLCGRSSFSCSIRKIKNGYLVRPIGYYREEEYSETIKGLLGRIEELEEEYNKM